MAAITFPDSPTLGDYHTVNGKSWRYDGVGWSYDPAKTYQARGAVNGAKLRLTADDTAQDYNGLTAVPWDGALYDTGSFTNVGTYPTRITIPTGVTYAKLTFQLSIAAYGNNAAYISIVKNGTTTVALVGTSGGYYTTTGWLAETGIIAVSPGDYFEAKHINTDASITIDHNGSFFQIEVVEEAPGNPFVPGARIGTFFTGSPTASEVVLSYICADDIDFPDDFSGCVAKAATAATASTVFDVKKNGSSIGSITFAAAGTTGTFVTTGGSVSFVIGDILTVVAPASPDATLAGVSLTFKGNYA